MFDAGANYFILAVKPRLFIPMHWQGRSEVAVDFARRAKSKTTEVVAMTKPGEYAQITFSDASIFLHIVEPPQEKKDEKKPAEAGSLKSIEDITPTAHVTLEAYNQNDPFADTDLPVSLDD